MKNETTRTKTLSGFSSRAIALVLCFVMLLTAIGSGSVLSAIAADFEGNGASVLLDAAKAGASVDVAADVAAADDKAAADEDEAPLTKKADSDLADTGRDADVASTGYNSGYLHASWNSSGDFDNNWNDFTMTYTNNQLEYSVTLKANYKYYLDVVANSDWYGGTSSDKTISASDSSDCALTMSNKQDIVLNTMGSSGDYVTVNFYATVNDNNNKRLYVTQSVIPSGYSLWGGEKKELNATQKLTTFTKNASTGYYDAEITLSSTNWYSLMPSASSGSDFQRSWMNYNEVAWALNTYNSNTVYKNYSSWHREPSSGSMSSGILNYVEITDYSSSSWGLKVQAKAAGTVLKLTYDPTNKIMYLYGDSPASKVTVYAKDGAAPINWKDKTQPGATSTSGYNEDGSTNYYYNFGRVGDTVISQIGGATPGSGVVTDVDCGYYGTNSSSTYNTAQVDAGKTVKITTTISTTVSSWRSRYYVVGWCVNGVTYKSGTDVVGVNDNPNTSTSSYTFTYTIPSDVDKIQKDKNGNPVIEITPIYYTQSKTNVVTFYLEGFTDVQSKWGNTPYVYPFYGDRSGYQNNFGTYPGQPMVNVSGQYSIEIPINNSPIYVSATSDKVKGITISNGYADHVHRNLVYGWKTGTDVNDDKDHMQTYDFDDFYKIYEERLDAGNNHPNAIFFRIKEETTKYNRSTYGGGSNSGQFASGTSSISISTIASSGNGWELMKDRHDRNVNIFGDYNAVSGVTATSATADTSNAIYVVSTGYNANIAGDYGTMWKIYDGSGNLITKDTTNSRYGIPPSLLNLRGSASGYSTTVNYPSASRSVDGVGSYTDSNAKYQNIYKTLQSSTYTNKLVYITYEKDTQDTRYVSSGTGAYRVDGKWFYTHASDNVQSTIGIEYYNKSTGKWIADTMTANTGKGSTTQATATFNNGSYLNTSNKITSTNPLISAGNSWSFTASETGTNYAFDGWYIKYGDSYDPVTGSTTAGTIKATANYSLIARYVPTSTGSVTISHKLDPASTGAGTVGVKATYGDTTYNGTVGDDGIARVTIPGVTYHASNTFTVTLTSTPKDDGKVTGFGYDEQVEYTKSEGSTPGAENTAVTSTVTIARKELYGGDHTTQLVTDLDYTSTITATPHYYEFTYNFAARDKTNKKYVTRGEITQDHYEDYVSSSHQVSADFVKSRAPFESNFMKTLRLNTIGTTTYNSTSHLLSVTSSYSATPYTPVYDVKIKLPYNYRTEDATESGVKYKKYNANGSDYNENQAPFTLKANYDEFVTIGATETKAGAQTKVSKVVDVAADPNHTGNDFITAPNTLVSSGTTMYFRYWEIKRLADNDKAQSTAPVVSRVYFPDFNYRIYCDSYVEAVYTTTEADYWANVKANNTYSDITCSVLYLESSRNQWNMMNGTTSTAATDATAAADKIYNDFIFNYNYKGKENLTSSDVEIGMVLERVYTGTGNSRAWVKGSSNVTDMDSYRTSDAIATENKEAIADWLKNGGTAPTGCVKQEWGTQYLNNKNYTEQPYSVYSAYGQTVETHSISFATPSTVDEYVYRAWAYIKDKNNGNAVTVSDPAYFSMAFIASANYSE